MWRNSKRICSISEASCPQKKKVRKHAELELHKICSGCHFSGAGNEELAKCQSWSITSNGPLNCCLAAPPSTGRKRGRAVGSSSAPWCPGSVGLALVPVSSGLWPTAGWGWQSDVLKGLRVQPVCHVPGFCWPCLDVSIHPALLFLLHTLPGVRALCLCGASSYYFVLI